MKKLVLIMFALGMIIPATAHQQKVRVNLSLWNAQPFNITIDGYTMHDVFDFNTELRPGKHFVKIWIHERTHRGGRVKVLHTGYMHVGNSRFMSGTITHHGDIRWGHGNQDRPRYHQRDFSGLYRDMDQCTTDQYRMQLALDFTIGMQLTAMEFEMILTHLRFDRYRYEFARNRYRQCSEPQNFYRCANTIRNHRQRQELMAWSYKNNQGHRNNNQGRNVRRYH